jgi:hypothetical protein
MIYTTQLETRLVPKLYYVPFEILLKNVLLGEGGWK